MSSERPKQTAFRLPQRTLDILDQIVEEGKARTRTDALILAVDRAAEFLQQQDGDLRKRIESLEEQVAVIKLAEEIGLVVALSKGEITKEEYDELKEKKKVNQDVNRP